MTVDSAQGQTAILFTNPAQTGVISVRRQDAGWRCRYSARASHPALRTL